MVKDKYIVPDCEELRFEETSGVMTASNEGYTKEEFDPEFDN